MGAGGGGIPKVEFTGVGAAGLLELGYGPSAGSGGGFRRRRVALDGGAVVAAGAGAVVGAGAGLVVGASVELITTSFDSCRFSVAGASIITSSFPPPTALERESTAILSSGLVELAMAASTFPLAVPASTFPPAAPASAFPLALDILLALAPTPTLAPEALLGLTTNPAPSPVPDSDARLANSAKDNLLCGGPGGFVLVDGTGVVFHVERGGAGIGADVPTAIEAPPIIELDLRVLVLVGEILRLV